MKRCRFCANCLWGLRGYNNPWESVSFFVAHPELVSNIICTSKTPNYVCDKFHSGGVLPETYTDMEVDK